VNNLANDPAYADVLQRMRQALDDWRMDVRDIAVIPETEYTELAGTSSLYDYVRSASCPFEEIVKASDLAILGNASDINTFVDYLDNENSAIKYWGATGLLVQKENARSAIAALEKAAYDPAGSVATIAAEALYGLGEEQTAIKAYINILTDTANYKMVDRVFAMNSIDAINDASPAIIDKVTELNKIRMAAAAASRPANQAGMGMGTQRQAGTPVAAAGTTAQRPTGSQAQQAAPAGAMFGAAPGGPTRSAYDEYYNNLIPYLLRKWGKME